MIVHAGREFELCALGIGAELLQGAGDVYAGVFVDGANLGGAASAAGAGGGICFMRATRRGVRAETRARGRGIRRGWGDRFSFSVIRIEYWSNIASSSRRVVIGWRFG